MHIDGKVTVEDALRRMIDYGEFQSKKIGFSGFVTPKEEMARKMGASLQGVISMVLYLCQKNLDLRPLNKAAQEAGHPKNPPPQKTKRGPRYFAAEAKHWECGFRIGPALEEAKRSVSCAGDETQATRRAHLRRAHWHTYWTGKGRLKPEVKWLHPILVGTADDTVPTVREVPCKK